MSAYEELMDNIKMSDTSKKKIKNMYREVEKKEERYRKIAKGMKPAAAIAVCMVIVLVMGSLGNYGGTSVQNKFALTVEAAELIENNYVAAVIDGQEQGWAFSDTEDGQLSYYIETPFGCTGDNIRSITYQINKGAFQVIAPEGQSVITSGVATEALNTPTSTKTDDDRMNFYSEYTVDYDNQSSDAMTYALCGITPVSNVDAFFNLYDEYSLQEQNQVWQDAFDDIVVTCTVTFEDGTTDSKEIALSCMIMTAREAEPDNNVANPEQKSNYVVFELK